MKFAWIQTEKATYPLAKLCRWLDVTPSGFYAWRARPEPTEHALAWQCSRPCRPIHAVGEGKDGLSGRELRRGVRMLRVVLSQ